MIVWGFSQVRGGGITRYQELITHDKVIVQKPSKLQVVAIKKLKAE